ncbi:hypothetical protein EVG20_g1723 [Dentipellis fragilis]|uniref:Uncharacterized protein n=1 Tax=Dentipellis fragilis TaxID=205917 RepID=A0A4Y9Z9R9_9AGAM|nr:hypothetical protein EVG20_g1723 [Dentipellis fragilis]
MAECMAAEVPPPHAYTSLYSSNAGYANYEWNPIRLLRLDSLPQRSSTRAELNRFDLKLSLYEKHVELWDKPQGSTYGWKGLLVLTDRQVSASTLPEMPYVEIRLDCRTHTYDGPFSAESNDLPAFTIGFGGVSVDPANTDDMPHCMTPDDGIVVERGWKENRNVTLPRQRQWYVKFWVPVPMALFRKVEMRMFKVKAMASVVDDKTCRRTLIYSGVELGDISHLRKQRDMDRAVSQK